MALCVQCERDEDGRWLAKMPGAIAYGETIEEAVAKVEALHLQASDAELEISPSDASPKSSDGDSKSRDNSMTDGPVDR